MHTGSKFNWKLKELQVYKIYIDYNSPQFFSSFFFNVIAEVPLKLQMITWKIENIHGRIWIQFIAGMQWNNVLQEKKVIT